MLTLLALAITLAVQAQALDLLTPPSVLGELPVKRLLPLPGPFRRSPPTPNGSPPIRRLADTPPVVKNVMSSSKLYDYLNTTLPPQIEKMLMCADVDLAGVLGTVLDTVSNLDVLSLLDLSSSLNILGDGGLSGVLGKGSNSKSSKSPLSSLSKATDAVSNLIPLAQGALGGLLPNTVEKDPAKKADQDSSLLSNLPLPLGGVLNKVGELKESTEGVLKSAVPSGINDALSGVLGNINVKDLLIGLEVQKATVENMMLTMTDDEILVQAVTTAFIGGKGLLGPVISILGFQINGDVTLKIGVSTNDTQCVSLQVQDKDIKATKVYLQLVKTVTDTLPLPIPLPLDDVISQLLTVAIKEKMKESTSCDIDLSDFSECKNCEYKHLSSLGLPRSMQGDGQAP
ncbi:vomeromodulin-like [Eptesicus fuscus]|uniref:vomeromodulin-like n=1 Tax=Eptesicus fuscus TaxID=29078 RepID=UPI0024047583|nr:vomeromodulin-like [Eptesicus fuscus]